jgi:very-short-patch-repair endonuclease
MGAAVARMMEHFGAVPLTLPGGCTSVALLDAPTERDEQWYVDAQSPFGAYRADFVMALVRPEGRVVAVVECDGHDFHERTKEQAKRDRKRDRAMQSAGFLVMRFTGSEVYADAIGCVGVVYAAIRSRMSEIQMSILHARMAG